MFCAWPATAVFMPITSPAELDSGPPEFPGLMAASVWMRCSRRSFSASIVRSMADTMPRVTVGPPGRARALPMATTSSPTRMVDDRPRVTVLRLLTPCILTTATSAVGSLPSRTAS